LGGLWLLVEDGLEILAGDVEGIVTPPGARAVGADATMVDIFAARAKSDT
jgi:hypothetical protein